MAGSPPTRLEQSSPAAGKKTNADPPAQTELRDAQANREEVVQISRQVLEALVNRIKALANGQWKANEKRARACRSLDKDN